MTEDDDQFLNEPGLNRGDRALRKLYRALSNVTKCWHTCDMKSCRRGKQCRGDAQICVGRSSEGRELSDEQHQAAIHDFRQTLTMMIAKNAAKEDVAAPAPSSPARTRRRTLSPGDTK